MALDKTIFKDRTLSDLFEEIHDNSSNTRNQVGSLIAELKPLIENIGDATLVVPMIKEYMEIGGKERRSTYQNGSYYTENRISCK